MARWASAFAADESPEESAICIVFSGRSADRRALPELAAKHFGPRVVIDPRDDGDRTKVLIAEDLERTLVGRGCHAEWIPYEIWAAAKARRWTEGLKTALGDLGLSYAPDRLEFVTCGRAWGGCHTKYSMFMAVYLGLAKTPDPRADLCPGAGNPFAAEFRERVEMDRRVHLFMFELPDGRPMGQFMDSLRAVWEPPHAAAVDIDPDAVELVTSANEFLPPRPDARVVAGGIVADVGDGCQPGTTTIVGRGVDYEALKSALAGARITPKIERSKVHYRPGMLA
jgi:hypothetical protein